MATSKVKVKFRKELLSNIVLADWNYKEDDEQTKEKLKANIVRNGFLQNIVIRKLGDKFEVVDGNHRVVALKELEYKSVDVCDVGDVPEEQAKIIAISLNETSFDNNEWLLSNIMKDLTVSYDSSELEQFMPYTKGSIDNMVSSADIDFNNLENQQAEPSGGGGFNTITVQVKDDIFEKWLSWCNKVQNDTDNDSKAFAFEQSILNSLNG